MSCLENIERILNSDAGLVVRDISRGKELIDNRFALIVQCIEQTENKDDSFYAKLIRLVSGYIDKLYDGKTDVPTTVFDENGEELELEYDELSFSDTVKLNFTNKCLTKKLFEYICSILEANKDVELDVETLKRLLNRSPKKNTLSVEEELLYRPFDYKRLVEIINKNGILKKLNISVDDIYQILYETWQLNNEGVFGGLVTPTEFNQNHQKVDEVLNVCNVESFVEITNIIRRIFDKNFDRFKFAKKRSEDNFRENLIIVLLHHPTEEDYALIHQILTDSEIQINYNLYYADSVGDTDLKSLIALSGEPQIIRDLLSKEQNVQAYYRYGETSIQLFRLYAIIGEREKALASFNESYDCACDYTGEYNNELDRGECAYGYWQYEDSVAGFIDDLCTSFDKQNTDYQTRIAVINEILNSNRVRYINLEETLPAIERTLSEEDFKALVDFLVLKRNSGALGFIVADEIDDLVNRYAIRLATEEEIQSNLAAFKAKDPTRVFISQPAKNDDQESSS